MTNKPFLVGITGGSGSGKTTFLKRLVEAIGEENVAILTQDNYYINRAQQPKDINGVEDYDRPESFDFEQYRLDLSKLLAGESIEINEYTYNKAAQERTKLVINAAKIVVTEGIFVFHFPEISKLINLKVFVDAKEAVKMRRRIFRDAVERGYDMNDVLYRYENHVTPSYERYIKPIRHEADIIIPNNADFSKGLEVLTQFLKSKIKQA